MLRAIFTNVIGILMYLVPCVIIVINRPVDSLFNLFRAHPFQIFRREKLVKLHFHPAVAILQIILWTGEIATSNHRIVNRYFMMLEQLSCTQRHRLVCAGDRAHALRKDTYSAAGFYDSADLLDRVKIGGEVFLGNHPQEPEHKGQVELYLRWLKKHEMREGENDPVALILCSEKSQETVELMELNQGSIHVAEYLTKMPPKKSMARFSRERMKLVPAPKSAITR